MSNTHVLLARYHSVMTPISCVDHLSIIKVSIGMFTLFLPRTPTTRGLSLRNIYLLLSVTLQGVRADIFWPQTREEANQFRCFQCLPSESGAVTMVKTEIINATEGVLCLKEGNAGVYRSIKNLEAKGKYVIEVDPNATYREYVVVSTPSDEKVFITSDDCIDNAKITVVADPTTGAYKFNGNARGDTTAAALTDEPAPGGFLSRLKKNLPWKK